MCDQINIFHKKMPYDHKIMIVGSCYLFCGQDFTIEECLYKIGHRYDESQCHKENLA